MKFKFINLTVNLPDDATLDSAISIKEKIKDFIVGLGLNGSLSVDVCDDIGTAPVKKSA